MKRVGVITNIGCADRFPGAVDYEGATAEAVLAVTGGNTGNVAFVHAVKKLLADGFVEIEWDADPSYVKSALDHIVICCANQLGTHVDLGGWSSRIEAFGLPVTLVGLGAQSPRVESIPELPPGTMRFLEVVSQQNAGSSTNIIARGEFTRATLNAYGFDAAPSGCPSLLISPAKALGSSILDKRRSRELRRIAVAAGNPWHSPSACIEHKLVEIVDARSGEYFLQHPVGMLRYAMGEEVDETTRERFLHVYGARFDHRSLQEWYRRNAVVMMQAPFWMRYLQKFDLVVGPRYHGVALGIQAGVQGTVIAIDARVQELCETTGVPWISLEDAKQLRPEEIVQRSLWDEARSDHFDRIRLARAHEYYQILTEQKLECSTHLRGLAE